MSATQVEASFSTFGAVVVNANRMGGGSRAVEHQGIGHVGLSVADLDRSLIFYRDLLGLDVVRIIEANPETGLVEVVGIAGAIARIAHLESEQGRIGAPAEVAGPILFLASDAASYITGATLDINGGLLMD